MVFTNALSINLIRHYDTNNNKYTEPCVITPIMTSLNDSPLSMYIKCIADMYIKNNGEEYFAIEHILKQQNLTFEDIGFIPCTKEEFYDTNWSLEDFQ